VEEALGPDLSAGPDPGFHLAARGVSAGMSTPEDSTLDDRAATRAEPLPEERVAERGDEDRRAEVTEILRESEERVAEAADGAAPGDAAVQHRTSAEATD
jgi:hypothetical protein